MGAFDSLANLAGGLTNLATTAASRVVAQQALAETIPSIAGGMFYARDRVDLVDKSVTYGAMYRSQPAVATVVDKRANALARLSLNVWDNSNPGVGKVRDASSPLAHLIASPNRRMSPFNFWRWVASTYDVYGEAYLLKIRDRDGNVTDLAPMHPTRLAVKRNEAGEVVYTFTLGAATTGIIEAPEDDVVPIIRYNPESLMRGMSRLEPLRVTLANEDAARRANLAFWKRGARPATVLKHPGQLSNPATVERLRTQFNNAHAGPDATGGTVVLDEGMDVVKMQLDAEEMQYIESRKLNTTEVCMVFDVPPPVVHILDRATFSNISEQMRSMYRDTMAPLITEFESAINTFLVPEFDPAGARVVSFALDEVMRGDFETRATAVSGLVTNGVMTPSEARVLFDLPQVGGAADALYANQALQVLGSVPTGYTAPADAPEPVEEGSSPPPKAMSRKAVSMAGRIRSKSTRKAMRDEAAAHQRRALEKPMKAQAEAIMSSYDDMDEFDADADAEQIAADIYDPEDWMPDLEEAMADPTHATIAAFATAAAKRLGGKFDPEMVVNWVATNVENAARGVTATTAAQVLAAVQDALTDADNPHAALADRLMGLVEDLTGSRLDQIAETRATTLAGFGEQEGAAQAGARQKTWVTGDNPRETHAAMDGETVELDGVFSNGMKYPGDPSGDVDEIAGCNCSLDF